MILDREAQDGSSPSCGWKHHVQLPTNFDAELPVPQCPPVTRSPGLLAHSYENKLWNPQWITGLFDLVMASVAYKNSNPNRSRHMFWRRTSAMRSWFAGWYSHNETYLLDERVLVPDPKKHHRNWGQLCRIATYHMKHLKRSSPPLARPQTSRWHPPCCCPVPGPRSSDWIEHVQQCRYTPRSSTLENDQWLGPTYWW